MSIVIVQNKPQLPSLESRRWYQPVRSETLGGIADAANNVFAVKSAGHLTHRFQWSRTSVGIDDMDPGVAAQTLHRVYLPVRNPFSTHFTWSLFVQGHDFNSGGLNASIDMCVLNGLRVDEPANGNNMVDGKDQNAWALTLDVSNGGIPIDGRVDLGADAAGVRSFNYPVQEVRGVIVRGAGMADSVMPTGPRALRYGSQAGTDNTLTVMLKSTLCRPIQISINEVSPIVAD